MVAEQLERQVESNCAISAGVGTLLVLQLAPVVQLASPPPPSQTTVAALVIFTNPKNCMLEKSINSNNIAANPRLQKDFLFKKKGALW